MGRKNFQVTALEDGKKYWISRSIAVCVMLYVKNYETQDEYVLLGKRGPGCPDEIGKWSLVTGYVDWDETLEDALRREVWEETGLKLPKDIVIKQTGINDSITGENSIKQNITIRYTVFLDYIDIKKALDSGIINNRTQERGGEKEEVSEIKLLPLDSQVNEREFAFGHGKIINEIINSL